MLISYAGLSKADGSQSLDLQRDALREAGVSDDAIYEDQASGQREDRPGLAAFLKAARQGDVIVVWRIDRLGRNLRHLVNLVQDLNDIQSPVSRQRKWDTRGILPPIFEPV